MGRPERPDGARDSNLQTLVLLNIDHGGERTGSVQGAFSGEFTKCLLRTTLVLFSTIIV